MSRNVNREPSRKEVVVGTLKFIAGTAALLTGAFALSKLAVFTGKDFMTPGLTDDQILVMDKHNGHHRKADGIESFGRGLVAGTGSTTLTPKQLESITKINKANAESLDSDVKDLPGTLAHTH